MSYAGLRDGVVLHLVPEHEAPAEPVVCDLLDLVESDRPYLGWSAGAQAWTLSSSGVLLVFVGVVLWTLGPQADSLARLSASAAALWVSSALAAASGARPAAWCCATAFGLLAGGALVATDLTPGAQAIGAAAAMVLMIAAVAWCAGQFAACLVAGLTWLTLACTAAAVWVASGAVVQTSAVVLVLSTVTVGVLPRVALSLSGVFTLDARIAGGHRPPRVDARSAIAHAHDGLRGAVAVCAIGFAGSGCVVARYAESNRWAWALVMLSLVGWLARCRHFPLAAERAAMALAGAVVVAGISWSAVEVDSSLRSSVVLVCLVAGAMVVVSDSLHTSPVSSALSRRWIQRVEAVAVIGTPPCLVGLFGVYADLLATF